MLRPVAGAVVSALLLTACPSRQAATPPPPAPSKTDPAAAPAPPAETGNPVPPSSAPPEILFTGYIGLAAADDRGINYDIKVDMQRTRKGKQILLGTMTSAGLEAGTSPETPYARHLKIKASEPLAEGDTLSVTVSARISCKGSRRPAGRARISFNDPVADSDVFVGTGDPASDEHFYLRDMSTTSASPVPGLLLTQGEPQGPRRSIDVMLDSTKPCPERPFKPFDTWVYTF